MRITKFLSLFLVLVILTSTAATVLAKTTPPTPASWSGWTSQGGALTDAPAATGFNGKVYVFAKGSNNALYMKSSADGVSFTGWQNLGGLLTAAPAAASMGGQLYILAKGSDNGLYIKSSSDGATFTGWRSLGGNLTAPPAATGVGNTLYIFAKGSDNALYLNRSNDGVNFSGWQNQGGNLTAAPAATAFQGRVYVFGKGVDNGLYAKSSADGVNFSGWQNLGGRLDAAPAAASYVSDGSETLYVFANGSGNAVYERHTTDAVTYTDWSSLGGQASGPPAAASNNGQIYAFIRGLDNTLAANMTISTVAGVKPKPNAPTSPAPTPPAAPAQRQLYGIVGQGVPWAALDPALLQAQYTAGVRMHLVELGWDVFQPNGPADWSLNTVQAYQQRIDALIAAGPDVQLYLDLGVQYAPAWVSGIDPLMDQYGNTWSARASNGGGVNIYWSPVVRAYYQTYIQKVFTSLNFRGRLSAVRVGTYGGELLYPRQVNPGTSESFWAYDATAQAQSPVPGWRPGQPSPNGEAQRFYLWYVDNLTSTFNFIFTEIRRYYAGNVAPVTPGGGMWDQLVTRLVSQNLYDANLSYYGTGNYWQRIYAMLPGADQNVINWCSSVGDASGVDDNSTIPWDWSAAHQHAYLAQLNGRQIIAENPGRNPYDTSGGADPRRTMQWIFQTTQTYGYMGLLWVRQSDMSDPRSASLRQYGLAIAQYR